MDNEQERLSGIIDDLAADRDPAARKDLPPQEAELAEVAAMLRAAVENRLEPRDEFVDSLAQRLSHNGDAPAAEQPAPPRQGLSRRSVLQRAAAAVAGIAVAGGGGAAAAYEKGKSDGKQEEAASVLTAPMVPDDRGSWQHTGFALASVPVGSAVRFRTGALEGFLVNPGNGRSCYALSAVCTHMGCMLTWLNDAATFLCPCHGAQYDSSGLVLSGIARHPLPPLRVKVEDDGDVYVWSVGEHPTTTTIAPYTIG